MDRVLMFLIYLIPPTDFKYNCILYMSYVINICSDATRCGVSCYLSLMCMSQYFRIYRM